MDTVHSIIEKIAPAHLEAVSIALVKTLLKRRTLHSVRLLSGYHVVSMYIVGLPHMLFSGESVILIDDQSIAEEDHGQHYP